MVTVIAYWAGDFGRGKTTERFQVGEKMAGGKTVSLRMLACTFPDCLCKKSYDFAKCVLFVWHEWTE